MLLRACSVPETDARGRQVDTLQNQAIVGNRIYSNHFGRLCTESVQYVFSNGVTLASPDEKARLGPGFDHALEEIAMSAVVCGCSWGYWNADHLEIIKAAGDANNGFVALVDERTSSPRVGVQFWQIDAGRPLYVRLFEADGVTLYATDKDNKLTVIEEKRPYVQTVLRDGGGETVLGGTNYPFLPVVPMWANSRKISELTPAIKSKIDAYDTIFSDFCDNLEQANDVYWVLNNFGGSKSEIVEMISNIQSLKMISNFSDGTGTSSVEPHTFEVPYAARQTALELLEKALVKDFMGVDGTSITGGSLTNVAIKAAMTDMDMKANALEWQGFVFVQQICRLAGFETEQITFKRRSMNNDSETIADIQAMRSDIDAETALRLNPYIEDEAIEPILRNLEAERVSGLQSVESLEREINGAGDAA